MTSMKKLFICLLAVISALRLTNCSTTSTLPFTSSESETTSKPLFASGTNTTWNQLQHYSADKLTRLQQNASDPTEPAWIQLALINKRESTNTPKLLSSLMAWRA